MSDPSSSNKPKKEDENVSNDDKASINNKTKKRTMEQVRAVDEAHNEDHPMMYLVEVLLLKPVEHMKLVKLNTLCRTLEKAKSEARSDFLREVNKLADPISRGIHLNNDNVEEIGHDLIQALWNTKTTYIRDGQCGSDQIHCWIYELVWDDETNCYMRDEKSIYHLPKLAESTKKEWKSFINSAPDVYTADEESYQGHTHALRTVRPEQPLNPAKWPTKFYLVETKFIIPVYDTYVESTTCVYLTEQEARAALRKQFVKSLDRNFRGGQESISNLGVNEDNIEMVGTDFIVSMWNTCDRGARPDYNQALQGRVVEMIWNTSFGMYQQDDSRVLYKLPGRWLAPRQLRCPTTCVGYRCRPTLLIMDHQQKSGQVMVSAIQSTATLLSLVTRTSFPNMR